jgi:hypothetical protein
MFVLNFVEMVIQLIQKIVMMGWHQDGITLMEEMDVMILVLKKLDGFAQIGRQEIILDLLFVLKLVETDI